jgi:hypothetical protein
MRVKAVAAGVAAAAYHGDDAASAVDVAVGDDVNGDVAVDVIAAICCCC